MSSTRRLLKDLSFLRRCSSKKQSAQSHRHNRPRGDSRQALCGQSHCASHDRSSTGDESHRCRHGRRIPGDSSADSPPGDKAHHARFDRQKLAFVSQSVEELGLSANIVHARAEEAGQGELRESFDFAVSRAVAAMNILCEYCLPFVKVGGTFCAMKGAKGAEELDCAGKAIATLGGETQKTETLILPDGGERVLINVKRYRTLRQNIRALRHRFQKSRSYNGEKLPNGSFLPDRKQWTTAFSGDMLLSQRNGGSSIIGKDKCHGSFKSRSCSAHSC